MDKYLTTTIAEKMVDMDFGAYDPISEAMRKHATEMERKKEALITQKLTEKGFGHLVEGIASRIFPRIACVKHNGWEYYYADNGVGDGVFIVAIKEYEFNQVESLDDYSVRMEGVCKWQDTEPLVR